MYCDEIVARIAEFLIETVILVTKGIQTLDHPTFLILWTVFVPVFSSARGRQRRRTMDCLDPCPRLVALIFSNKPSTQLGWTFKCKKDFAATTTTLFYLFWNCGCNIASKLVSMDSCSPRVWLFFLFVLGWSAFTLVMLFHAGQGFTWTRRLNLQNKLVSTQQDLAC